MRKICSFFLTIFVCLVIILSLIVSLDLVGIINLPKNFSIKDYLSKSIGTIGIGEEIYYPDYNATGLTAEYINNYSSELNEEKIKKNKGQIAEETNLDQEALSQVMQSINNENKDNVINKYYNVTDNSFFYTQLDTYGKTLYSRLYSNLDNLKTGTYTVDFGVTFNDLLKTENGDIILTNAFQLAINALLLDHPEIFYLDVTKMYMFTESTTNFVGTTYKISIGPDAGGSYLVDTFSDKQDVIIAEENMRMQIDNIISNLNGNTYQKILQIHNYLIDNITYDSDSIDTTMSHTIYGALINRLAVCDGYAKAFKYILDSIGISCIEVCGIAQNSSGTTESHAWNDVLLEGDWYAVDVTWDDPIIIGGNGKLTDDLRYNYFLKGSDIFFGSHQEDGYIVSNGAFWYPEINRADYR